MKLLHPILALTAIMYSLPVTAQSNTVSQVDFSGVPSGTKCNADAPHASRVKVKKAKNEIRVKIKGNAVGATFHCTLPSGQRLIADIPAILPSDVNGAMLQTYFGKKNGIFLYKYNGRIIKANAGTVLRISN